MHNGSMENLLYSAAIVAAVIHAAIFVLESLAWKSPRVQRMFGARTEAQAEALGPVLYNQGFYNLFVGIGVAVGLFLFSRDESSALLGFSLSFMAAAALVLVGSVSRLWKAALLQGGPPALALLALAVI